MIPSLRGGPRLLETVERIVSGTDVEAEVVVADNGLPASDAAAVASAGARVLPMGANRGFGAAVNRAAAASSGDVLVVLNDDVSIADGFLCALLEPIAGGAAAAAGVLLRQSDPGVIETAGIVVDALLSPYDHLQGRPAAVLDADPAPPAPLGPCGGAAAFRRDAFHTLGGFDENLFAYGEDVDLALRLAAAGGTCSLAPRARAVHAGSGTLGYASQAKAELVGFARGYLLRK